MANFREFLEKNTIFNFKQPVCEKKEYETHRERKTRTKIDIRGYI